MNPPDPTHDPPAGPQEITALLLAGGQATRMGGLDKGLLPLRGRPLAAWVLDRLRPQAVALAVNANRHAVAYAALGVPVWADHLPGQPGPLAGWHAGLLHSGTPWLLTAPCDAPYLPLDLAVRLRQAVQDSGAALAVAACPDGGDKLMDQPVFALLHRSLLPALEAAVAQGQRGVTRFASSHGAARAVFVESSAFANVNTPAQLQALESALPRP